MLIPSPSHGALDPIAKSAFFFFFFFSSTKRSMKRFSLVVCALAFATLQSVGAETTYQQPQARGASSEFPAPIPAAGSLDFPIPDTPTPMQMPGMASSISGMGQNAIVPAKRPVSSSQPRAAALEAPADSSSSSSSGAMDMSSSSTAAGTSATPSADSSSAAPTAAASSSGAARSSSASSSASSAVSSTAMDSSSSSSSSTGASQPVVYSDSALLFTPADPVIAASYNVNVNWFAAVNNRSQFDFVLCKAPGFQPRYASQIHLISPVTPYNPNSTLNKYVLVCAPYTTTTGACVFQPGPDGCVRGTVFGNFTYDASALNARVEITSNPPASSVFKLALA